MSEHREEFRRDGHTIVSGLFEPEALEALREALEQTINRVRANHEAYVPRYTVNTAELVDIWGVNDILSPELYQPVFGEIFENTRLMDAATDIADGRDLRFLGTHALFNPLARDYELHWHRDFGDDDKFDPTGGSAHVYMNICLLEDTALHVIPGSHRRPLTETEKEQQRTDGSAPLPGEKVVVARPGDVVFTNNHAFHRGACSTQTQRRTLHVGLQPADECTGGHSSYKYIRNEGYLDSVPPTLRHLMENLIKWEEAHPMPLKERMRRMRESRERRAHQAGVSA